MAQPHLEFESDFSLVQVVYGVALVLGLEHVAESLYATFITRPYMEADYIQFMVLKGMIALILALLGIRFFSAARNIRRFVLIHPDRSRITTTVHLPILLVHALLFYTLCRMEQGIKSVKALWGTMPLFTFLYCGLLVLNAVWLVFLIKGRDHKYPEIIWIWNNSIWAVVVLATTLAWRYFGFPNLIAFAAVFFFLFINSIHDLSKTAESYLSKMVPGRSDPPGES
jgi:hypothetical protein